VTLFTVGHSTRRIEDFLRILMAHKVELLVDVRTVPRSRTNPQFNRDSLPASLLASGVGYEHSPGLGGLRKPKPDSMNTGWRNDSFRGYADYMQTPEFWSALASLLRAAEARRTCVMCAEAVPWRCHRSMIADAVLASGHQSVHIMSETKADPHKLTSFAVIDSGLITYPGAQGRLL